MARGILRHPMLNGFNNLELRFSETIGFSRPSASSPLRLFVSPPRPEARLPDTVEKSDARELKSRREVPLRLPCFAAMRCVLRTGGGFGFVFARRGIFLRFAPNSVMFPAACPKRGANKDLRAQNDFWRKDTFKEWAVKWGPQ